MIDIPSGADPALDLKALVQSRYRDGDVAGLLHYAPMNETLATILGHRTVRSYRREPLPEGTLELLTAAAQSAPSSSNLQAWSVVAVQDSARKARLSKIGAGQKHIADAPLLLVFVADLARLRQVSVARGDTAEGLDYLECFIIALADAAFAAQNMLTSAESLGLGACYIGALRNDTQAVAEELRLPDDTFPVFGMTLGFPDPAAKADIKPRLPQSVILHREQYRPAAPAVLAAYDERIRGFRADQQMHDIGWTEQAALRIRNKAALDGRHVLRQVLEARRFGLR